MRLYHFLSAKYGLESIRDQKFKLSTYDDLNDPFELFPVAFQDKEVRDIYRRFKLYMSKTMALFCCSKSWQSTLLWSHYADRHRGLALELEVKDDLIINVKYQKERFEIDKSAMSGIDAKSLIKQISDQTMETKALDWSYENEARISFMIEHLDKKQRPLFMPYDDNIKLVGVIIGPLSTVTVDMIRDAIPCGVELQIQKARLAFGTFDIVPQKLFPPLRVSKDKKCQAH